MGFFKSQTNFTHGMLNKNIQARTDLEIYGKGAIDMTNMTIRPQGSAHRRFGTTLIEVLSETDIVQTVEFIFDPATRYLLLLTDLNLAVFLNDEKVVDVVSPITAAMISDGQLDFAQRNNQMVFVHPDLEPQLLQRGATDANWTFVVVPFRRFPQFDFDRLVPTTNYDDLVFTMFDVEFYEKDKITSSAPFFRPDHVGGTFRSFGPSNGTQIGFGYIDEFVSDTEVEVRVISPFDAKLKNGVDGIDVIITEPAISATRGWPLSITFYQNRLWFGGVKAEAVLMSGSVIGDYYNFDLNTGQDDDAIEYVVTAKNFGPIRHIVGQNSLVIYTTTGIFYVPQTDETPLTPSNFSIKQINESETSLRPKIQDVDNQLFSLKNGKEVISISDQTSTGRLESRDASLGSSDLIDQPVSSAALPGNDTQDVNYLFYVNQDGTLVTYNSLSEENVSAWTPHKFGGPQAQAKNVVRVGNAIYFIVKYTGSEVPGHLVKIDFDSQLDANTVITAKTPITSTIRDLDDYNETTITIKADGKFIGDFLVQSNEVTLDNPIEVISFEVGYNYIPTLATMPPSFQTQNGDGTYMKKRIIRVFVDLFESAAVTVDGALIPFTRFGNKGFEEPDLVTAVAEIVNLNGFNFRESPVISQTEPYPMTVLGIGYEIELGVGG